MNKISIAISVAALLMYGCSDKPKEQNESVKTEKTQNVEQTKEMSVPQNIYGASAVEQAQAPAGADMQSNVAHIANVLETMNGGGYTYAKVDESGNIYWIAGPQADVVVGTSISFIEQMVMSDFTSKALNRKFDELVFVSAIVPANKSAQNPAVQTAHDSSCKTCDKTMNLSMETKTSDAKAPEVTKVAKNAKGYSIEELYAKKADIKGKSIKVNAKVVKVSKNIMGKDWIHLQDGSGSVGTDDIIATSVNSTVQVGDTVTAQGVVKTDVDLGYGYNFSVIIEEAKFTSI